MVAHPLIDNVRLARLAQDYESSQWFDSPGGYWGLVISNLDHTERNLLGRGFRRGLANLVGCDCGIEGCWSLYCRIRVTDDQVLWSVL